MHILDKQHSFHASKRNSRRKKRRYCWIRIHPFSVSCLNVSTGKVKIAKLGHEKKILMKNGCSLSRIGVSRWVSLELRHKTYTDASAKLVMQVQELSVTWKFLQFFCTCQQFKNNKAIETTVFSQQYIFTTKSLKFWLFITSSVHQKLIWIVKSCSLWDRVVTHIHTQTDRYTHTQDDYYDSPLMCN